MDLISFVVGKPMPMDAQRLCGAWKMIHIHYVLQENSVQLHAKKEQNFVQVDKIQMVVKCLANAFQTTILTAQQIAQHTAVLIK